MVMTVNVDKYTKLIKVAKEKGYQETAFRVPLVDYEEVTKWLTEGGYRYMKLDVIHNLGYTGNAVKVDYQRLLVEWRD